MNSTSAKAATLSMESLRQSTALLAKYFDDVESQMRHVQTCLSMQFEDSYSDRRPGSASSEQYNPMKLLARINALEQELPELSVQLKTLMDEKSWLPCETMASTATKTSAMLRAVSSSPASRIPSADVLQASMERNRTEMEDRVTKYRLARYQLAVRDSHLEAQAVQFLDQNLVSNEQPALDLSSELFSTPEAEQNGQSREPKENCDSNGKSTDGMTENTGKRRVKAGNSRPGRKHQAESARAAKSSNSSSNNEFDESRKSSGFEPIKKTAFNRLPRNLKAHAGKLTDLNELLQKVYDALIDKGTSMTDAELMEATGETNTSRFSALRGLSILRLSDGNWDLAKHIR